ncbi:MAG TPA: hypothetical protein VKT49_23395 [Bryobacteraceae bacterium]|nr:hypothetical protein [Bryobacteraceae bacterium]
MIACVLAGAALPAQEHEQAGSRMGMVDVTAPAAALMKLASGTAVNPSTFAAPMIMEHFGLWNTMQMGTAFLADTQQSGPRGGDKLFAPDWFMMSAEHRLGTRGAFEAELMLSLEPATVTRRRYPELFQTGETAFGVPIIDGQHPHNFIMSLGVHYVRQAGGNTQVELYFAPVGDPALGPVAYPHRASAAELPEAPLAHHWQDSTHIADEVVTLGVAHRWIKLESSGFHGAEPGENRWTIGTGPIDSWSARLWFFPSRSWAAQVSGGRLAHPEALESGDQVRTTASLSYSRPFRGTAWSTSLIWGRNHNTATHRDLNSYLIESMLPVSSSNLLSVRAERVDKDELFASQPQLEKQLDRSSGTTFRVAAYTLGYTRDVRTWRWLQTGIGASFTAYAIPAPIRPFYGAHPVGGNVFIRVRLRPPSG